MDYSLRNGLSWCVCDDRVVFLDLPGDRYSCLSPTDGDVFRRWASGEPGVCILALERLTRLGVLKRGTNALPAAIKSPPVTRDLAGSAGSMARPQDILRAVIAQKRAEWDIRHRPFATVVQRHLASNLRESGPPEEEAAARSVADALAAATLFVRKADRCLARALAARSLCARRRLPSMLVFGVRLEPFAAHCWVQWADGVIVGDLEEARMFTPILVLS